MNIIISIMGLFFGISGWVTFFYNHISHKPKIKGRIFTPIIGHIRTIQRGDEKEYTTFLFYLYLTNKRKTPVRPFDYEMEITLTSGSTQKLERFYGNSINDLTFNWIDGREFNPNLKENLIYKKQQSIDAKDPLHGFVMFGGDIGLYEKYKNEEIAGYSLTIIDVFKERHTIKESNMDHKPNIYLLSDLANFELPFN